MSLPPSLPDPLPPESLPLLPPPPPWLPKPPRQRSAWQRYGRNVLLFALTAVSVYLSGGAAMTVALLSILLAHEMGHYLACRYYGVDATLPFFIPAPIISMVGTLGAVIRIRSPFPNRKALFDIGIAGPLAGFVVCLPVLYLGLDEARVIPDVPSPDTLYYGVPLLFSWVADWLGKTSPDGTVLLIGPLGRAAWFGLLVTALNLIPVGQLDGGHATYALMGRRSIVVSRLGFAACVGLIYFGPSWAIWSLLLLVLGRRHPPTLDDTAPVGAARVAVAILSAAILAVCFIPAPIVGSWEKLMSLFVTSR